MRAQRREKLATEWPEGLRLYLRGFFAERSLEVCLCRRGSGWLNDGKVLFSLPAFSTRQTPRRVVCVEDGERRPNGRNGFVCHGQVFFAANSQKIRMRWVGFLKLRR